MGLPSSTEAKTFYRAADRRLADALALLECSRETGAHTTGAMYLGGYAVECILSCLILHKTRSKDYPAILKRIFESKHNLETLKELYREMKGAMMPKEEAKCFVRVASWTVRWRYKAGLDHFQDANSFLEAVKVVVAWGKRGI